MEEDRAASRHDISTSLGQICDLNPSYEVSSQLYFTLPFKGILEYRVTLIRHPIGFAIRFFYMIGCRGMGAYNLGMPRGYGIKVYASGASKIRFNTSFKC